MLSLTGLCVIGLLAMGFYYFNQLPKADGREVLVSYPLTGQITSLDSAQCVWKEIPWAAGGDLEWRPQITLKIDSLKTQDGGVRVMFLNGKKQPVGDTNSFAIKNGVFEQTGTDEITFLASRGISGSAAFSEYQGTSTPLWTLVVKEYSATQPEGNILGTLTLAPTKEEKKD